MNNQSSFGNVALQFVLRAVLRPLFRVELTGDPKEFANERTLIVANHESFIDGALLGSFLPAGAIFVVHKQVTSK
jgi:acyl-[acyl-carrier-protein]-phospholipid O-acyltransferase / long-chain-fatty-acid--[acyl-carrier-protein] ligase